MAENTLVDRDIRQGEAIVRALDDAADPSMHPVAALWFLFPDEETWRLLLALPAMATDPAQSVYTRLLDIVAQAGSVEHFSFDSVGLMPTDNPGPPRDRDVLASNAHDQMGTAQLFSRHHSQPSRGYCCTSQAPSDDSLDPHPSTDPHPQPLLAPAPFSTPPGAWRREGGRS